MSIINHAVISTANNDCTMLTAEDLNKARDKVCNVYVASLDEIFWNIVNYVAISDPRLIPGGT